MTSDVLKPSSRFPRAVSTRLYLLLLVAGVVVPLLAFAAYLMTSYAANEQARFEREAARLARQVALVVDGELARFVAKLQGLAASSALARGDLAEFHAEATRLVEGRDELIVLRELDERQLVNTERPLGEPLPPAVPLSESELGDFAAGRSVISNVYASPLSGEFRVAVAVPIPRGEAPPYALAITFPTESIHTALLPAVPPGWLIGVGDRVGTIVTRSEQHQEFTGRQGLPAYLEQAIGRSGTFTSTNFYGEQVLAGYYRSPLSDWLFGANIPEQVVEAPLWRSLLALASLGTAALMLSGLLAYYFGTVFTSATSGLAERAARLGAGQPVPPLSSRIKEFVFVGDALAQAAASIEERSRERDKSEAQRQLLINELNHRVKNTLAIVKSISVQTLRGATSLDEAREALTSRLIALANAHDILTRESWEGANLQDIVSGVRGLYGGPDRLVAEGPAAWLSPRLSLSLALALHELATNASKYGGLSVEGGTVALTWEISNSTQPPELTMRWVERGGPPVEPPVRQGFGTRLIERSLSADIGGTVEVNYDPLGLTCTIQAPLRQ
ncbi:MAG TPA: sensor histidine kinase [Afifellaceae bacterium]|nr:sensor histidine kinase [Afifellaceae bacterium]